MYEFTPESHSYKVGKNTNTISVTTFIGLYKNEFPKEFWAEWKAWEALLFPWATDKQVKKDLFKELRKTLKVGGKVDTNGRKVFTVLEKEYPELAELVKTESISEVKAQWKKKNLQSTTTGTAYHDFKERESIARGVELNVFTGSVLDVVVAYEWDNGVKKQNLDLKNLKNGYYPELMVSNGEIIGQVDRPWVENGFVYIKDFKTGAKIDKKNPFQKMKYPISHLDDCKYNHYCLQLNLYMYLFLQLGYNYGDIAIDWYNEQIPVPNMQKEIQAMVLDYDMQNL